MLSPLLRVSIPEPIPEAHRRDNLRASTAPVPAISRGLPVAYDPEWNGLFYVPRPASYAGRETIVTVNYFRLRSNNLGHEALFWLSYAHRARGTIGDRPSNLYDISKFSLFLREKGPRVSHLSDINATLLSRFGDWIRDNRNWGAQTKAKIYNELILLLRYIRRHRPELASGDITLLTFRQRTKRFRAEATQGPKHPITLEEGSILEAHCVEAINDYYERWKNGQLLMQKAREAGSDPSATTLSIATTLGEILLMIQYARQHNRDWTCSPLYFSLVSACKLSKRYSQIPLHEQTRKGRPGRPRTSPILPYHSVRELASMISPNPDDLFPYFLMVAARTFANTSSLTRLPLDCFQPPATKHLGPSLHTVDSTFRTSPSEQQPDYDYIWWDKFRGEAGAKQMPFKPGIPHYPPALIRKVIEITTPIRSFAKGEAKNFVFIFERHQQKGGYGIQHYSNDVIGLAMRRLRMLHPHLPRFTIPSLRLRGSEGVLEATAGDIGASQSVLGHKAYTTTYNSYRGRLGKQLYHEIIARFLYYFQYILAYSRVSGKLTVHVGSASIAVATRERAEAPPKAPSPSPLAEMANQFAAAFEDTALIIEGDEERCARIIHFSNHLLAQKNQHNIVRWERAVGPVSRFILNEIIPRMDAKIRLSAESLAKAFSPLPTLE